MLTCADRLGHLLLASTTRLPLPLPLQVLACADRLGHLLLASTPCIFHHEIARATLVALSTLICHKSHSRWASVQNLVSTQLNLAVVLLTYIYDKVPAPLITKSFV